jgi:hypothetical protein
VKRLTAEQLLALAPRTVEQMIDRMAEMGMAISVYMLDAKRKACEVWLYPEELLVFMTDPVTYMRHIHVPPTRVVGLRKPAAESTHAGHKCLRCGAGPEWLK